MPGRAAVNGAAVVFRTSGSTGRAKEIARTAESLEADARALAESFPEVWGAVRLVVATVPRDHMYGTLWAGLAPAAAGCAVREGVAGSVEEVAAAAGEAGGGVLLATTPSFLEKAVEHPDFAGLRGKVVAVVTSGSPLRRETALAAGAALGTCPLEIYGSTEAGTVGWRRRVAGAGDGSNDAWNVFCGVTARVDGEGRLVVDSPYAMERPLAMGDLARMEGEGRFALLGRADRRVKILEEYVSLGAVERALEGHEWVAAARAEAWGEGVARVGALVVPSAAGRAALAGGTYGAVQRRLRQDLADATGRQGFPRRIRFVRALPADARGKTTVAAVRAALSAWCREPVVLEWKATAEALRAVVVFPPDCECFDGHFPGYAVLSGVAQLYFLRHFAKQAFGDFPEAATWRGVKFRKLGRPGRPLLLEVDRKGPGRFGFAYSYGADGRGGVVSSGAVEGALP